MVLCPEEEQKIIDDDTNNDNNPKEKKIYRLFIIGKKSLPEIRKTEARSSERFWAQVGGGGIVLWGRFHCPLVQVHRCADAR